MPIAPDSDARLAQPPRVPAWLIARTSFGTSAGVAVCSAALLWLTPAIGLAAASRGALVAASLGYALVCIAAWWASRWPRFPVDAVLTGVALLGILICAAIDQGLGNGVRGPAFGLSPVAVCIVCSICGLRWGLPLAAAALLLSAALAGPEVAGWQAAPAGAMPALPALAYRALAILGAVVGGGLTARVIAHFLHNAAEREQRFRGLLDIAADWYWEQDHLFRYCLISSSAAGATKVDGAGAPPTDWLRRTPWQIPDLGLSDRQLDGLRADLESHLPVSGLLIRRRDPSGRWRIHSISGEPRFGAGEEFLGYWGVARDVTEEVTARRAVEASETRYRELFTRSPSPIFLHRRGLIFDANPAAARLFGFANAAAMNGFDSLAFFPAGELRDAALRRLAELESLPVGTGLPVTDLQVRSVDGRSLSVQSTAVRVDTASGAAVLAIFYDITARQAVEGALRRSEAMLSHLFATSPNSLTLTDQASGRHALVNPAFCRLTGFSAEQVVGRTMADLGLWHDPRDGQRLAARLHESDDGTVTDWPSVFVARSGALLTVRLAVGRFVMDGRDYIVINAWDVTASERTRLEHAAILDRASIGIAFTRDRRFVQANPFFEAMFGWPRGSLISQPGASVWSAAARAEGGGGSGSGSARPGPAIGSGGGGSGGSGGSNGGGNSGVGMGGNGVDPALVDPADIDALAAPLLAAGQAFEIELEMCRRVAPAPGGHGARYPDAAAAASGAPVDRFWCRLIGRAVSPDDPEHGGTIWIAEDVTERRRLDQALAAARDAAEAASLAKGAFLANTSHEIRTPLNGLLGLARLALQPNLSEERRREYLQQILASTEGLAGILSDVLDVSKIEAGKITLDDTAFDLRDWLRAVHQGYQPLAESKGVELRLEIDRTLPPTVHGDPTRLRQLLSNFISNALKFTERGQVTIRALAVPGSGSPIDTRLSVSDTGPGIDADVQARLFLPFSQGDSSITRRYGGTGLGLSICRELARLMGGRVGVASRPGEGSTFWAELPLPAAVAPPQKARSTEADDMAVLSGKRALMVEDNPVNMMIGVAMLEHWGLDVTPAVDGRMAVDAVHQAVARGAPFHAVLMDVQMPVMSGHEATRELRRSYTPQELPIIALTAAALVSEREEALAAGMDEFLTKPIDATRLRQALVRRMGAPAAAAKPAPSQSR